MPLDPRDAERVRYHLGYLNVTSGSSLQYGMSVPVQTLFIVDRAIHFVREEAIPRVQTILNNMDKLELMLNPDNLECYLAAEQIDELKLRGAEPGMTYPDLLEREYVRWAHRLANLIGAPLYKYSQRFNQDDSINVRVS